MTESVWDYPRPPRVDPSTEHVVVTHRGVVLADTTSSLRVLETSHPPTYYLPRAAFPDGVLRPAEGASWCEWKGRAAYFDVVVGGDVLPAVAWTYPTPSRGFEQLVDHVALYPGRVERCTVDGEVVEPQPGNFYGGWITSRVTGPFKGGPGSSGW
ncbi:DUF427 domain-containing protein [Nocardioides eburneiflavus]|uniref:DUF427 domain-containing protein n=1 Tax=Nocardioides eburneiflavus TaxID=2518372 RepID=A0A4Z1C5Y4_9ACTN|nr:DUF427 domain-containing protein [Nocardioides eburneiflavus]TGN65634.1 DUF427 domain-containing protein [Nocardioides eburneiflavus]